MRWILAGAVVLLLTACNARQAGEWTIEQRADRISDKPQYTVGLVGRSRNARTDREQPAALKLAALQLMCFDDAPVVRLHFTHNVGSNRNSRLAYRFDERPPRTVPARVLGDQQTLMIEESQEVARFVDELRNAKRLSMQVTSLTVGTSSVDFNVDSAPQAIEKAYAACALPGAGSHAASTSAAR